MTAQKGTARRGRSMRFLLAAGLIAAIPFLLDAGMRRLYVPWSVGSGGRPTLTGDWLGSFTLDDGTTAPVFLTLGVSGGGEFGYAGTNVDGTAAVCLGGYRVEMEVYGSADRGGTIDELRFRPLEDDPVLLIGNVSATWAGETLALHGTYSFDPTAAHIVRSDQPSPPLNIVLQPGDREAFAAACGT